MHVYSKLALGKEREIVKEETALRKEKEAVYAVMYTYTYTCTCVNIVYMVMNSLSISP